MKKIVFLAFVLWLLSMSMFCTRLVVTVNGLTTYDIYPEDSIQEAINLAESGDIIFVHAGTYLERVVVNKTVSLMGEDKHNTIIYWNDTGSVVHVTADNTIITSFTLTLASGASAYPDSGIFLDDSDGNNISNNIVYGNDITNNGNGILLYKSSNNNISGNNITNNDSGIYLYDASSNNIISGNNITNNGNGIYIDSSSGNIIYHNNFINNAKHVDDFGLRPNPPRLSVNFWDDDYPSGGNYWDDYLTRYPNAKEIDGSGIGDTPYGIYEKNQDNYPLLPPWFPPTVSIISPENKTYTVADVPLSFTVSETTSWIGYSLDGQANVTITQNVTLPLPDGLHYVVVYANDTAGNMGESSTVYFTVDTVAPNIELLSPENKTYTTNSVFLSFTVSESTSWMGYSLDGKANETISEGTTLPGLSDGSHSLVVYASDMVGNMGSSDTVYFTIDTTLPSITILSPENKTYDTNFVPLSFTVDEQVSWMAYSLDGQANVTITQNVTLPLPDGLHYVVVYANDTAGNMGESSTVYFTVDSVVPSILLVSPT
ncbi:MAG: right-handed parallel beta-helix repeat-containing protein, partial [Candidatus Bathyarchaeota archaeon]|nr:right-handed parallel beta-helix repeat-containing protein [Candidatus Bathyarchaeota archaeon]